MTTATTTTTVAHHSPTAQPHNSDPAGSGPTNSPLLFFVALGFGVVFTNLWIIVGVKYCFRYNQRNRQARALNENGEPIDLTQLGGPPRRRRREKKLMSMEEVNERFPLTKYKTWRSAREAEGLPAAGGVTSPPSRTASMKGDVGTIDGDTRHSTDTGRPPTALSIAQQDHTNATSAESPDASEGASNVEEKTPEKTPPRISVEERDTTEATSSSTLDIDRNASVVTIDDEDDEDDPIRTAAPPEMLAAPGDSCAICLDTLDDDDDVRGLTCGHAFHAACVDPWLTSRRACCPLCKADYYIPKPRPDGSEDPAAATGRRTGVRGMPAAPPPVWIGGRAGIAFGRPRLILASPRFLMTEDGTRMYSAAPARPEQRRQGPTPQDTTTAENGGNGWRSRLNVPSVRLPRFGRRGQQGDSEQATTTEATDATPAELEAGSRR